jgi:hypothetical protein
MSDKRAGNEKKIKKKGVKYKYVLCLRILRIIYICI